MKLKFVWQACSFVSLACVGVQPTISQASTTPTVPSEEIAGWSEFADAVRILPAQILAKLPLSMQSDPQIRQEVARLALEAITSSALDTLASDGDHPVFVASISQALNVGQPNADTIYRSATITPGGSYRLRGLRGTLPIVKIGQVGPRPGEPGWKAEKGQRTYFDINTLKVDKQGRYDVLLSPTRPAGYTGDWWPLDPTTNKLLLRMVSSNWGKERDPTFAIERTDIPVSRSRVSAAVLEERLRRLPAAAKFIGTLLVGQVEKLKAEGFINKFKPFDANAMPGLLTGQAYYEGAYELKDDEALIVEVKAPTQCVYRSLILTNEIYQTLDWTNNHSSLNGAQAKVDKDGVLRVVIASRDPGVPNWLDTAGHQRGLIQGRWTDCNTQPTPSIRKVAFADVRAEFPPETSRITPEEREQITRDRRADYQQRPLW